MKNNKNKMTNGKFERSAGDYTAEDSEPILAEVAEAEASEQRDYDVLRAEIDADMMARQEQVRLSITDEEEREFDEAYEAIDDSLGGLMGDLNLVKKLEELEVKERTYLADREAFNAEYAEHVDAGYTEVNGIDLETWRGDEEIRLLETYDDIQAEKLAAFEASKILENGRN